MKKFRETLEFAIIVNDRVTMPGVVLNRHALIVEENKTRHQRPSRELDHSYVLVE